MRNTLAAAGGACALASPALALETSNFNLGTTGDLVALCTAQPDESLYAEALQFCYGYMAGMAQFHRALVQGAVRLTADPAGLLGPADRRLGHPELVRELPITGRAHPYNSPEIKS